MKTIRIALVFTALNAPMAMAQDHAHEAQVPESMRHEHDHIQKALQEATQQSGEVGAAARELKQVLLPHFIREEQIALPPLTMLQPLTHHAGASHVPSWVIPMTDTLRTELPRMLEEHKAIGLALQKLARAARAANNQQVLRFTEELAQHARSEEEMFYPMAVLVGEIVRSRTQHKKH